jgi:hypothetical protein
MTSRFADPEAKKIGFVPENRIDAVAFLDSNWKLIYREKAIEAGVKKIELYDRRTDRDETKNIAAQHPQEVDRMMTEIGKWTVAQKQDFPQPRAKGDHGQTNHRPLAESWISRRELGSGLPQL